MFSPEMILEPAIVESVICSMIEAASVIVNEKSFKDPVFT